MTDEMFLLKVGRVGLERDQFGRPFEVVEVGVHVLLEPVGVDVGHVGDCTVNGVTPIKEEHDEQAG